MSRVRECAIWIALLTVWSTCCGAALNRDSGPEESEIGLAAFYSDKLHGRSTASGEIYDKNKLTAAHRVLPFGTRVKVTNLSNRQAVQVRINDRGPFGNKERIIDLSRAAAERIGMLAAGVVRVKVEIVE